MQPAPDEHVMKSDSRVIFLLAQIRVSTVRLERVRQPLKPQHLPVTTHQTDIDSSIFRHFGVITQRHDGKSVANN